MGDIVKNHVSARDINVTRVSLVIPLIVTVFCSTLDMLFHIKNEMISISTFEEGLFWVLGTLISYYFPSFIAASITLLWQYYFAQSWSGIKEGKGGVLFLGTVAYLFFYIVYLLYADTYYIVVFAFINIIYALFVITRCIDKRILQRMSGPPNGQIVNSPN